MHKKGPQVVGWGRPNLMHSVKEKMLEAILKHGMIGWTENEAFKLGLHKISTEHNDNWKTL
jgi:hypothetical protein